QQQRVALARALAPRPQLLLLDEPTNGLDPPARRRMLDLIREIRDRGDLHIIISSHLLRDVEECCDQVLILKDGRIADTCDLEEERRANRKFLELETKGGGEEFVLDIERLGCQAAWSGNGRVKLVLPDGLEVRQIFRAAAERNVQIRRLNFRRDSLEDIFLRAMEDQPPAAAPAPAAPGKEAVHGGL
ncbi:MAG TPA: hypothetical protein DEH78_13795, partial [Solibacterales bacterium]|nr:hypothetical protein [Bryobacterales bacterium]